MTGNLTYIKSGLGRAVDQLHYLARTQRLVWAAARRWNIAWIALVIVQGLLPVIVVYLTRLLVDALVVAFQSGGAWAAARPVMILVALMAAVMLLMEVIGSAANWIRTVQSELLRDYISALIHRKSSSVDLSFYELPEFYDHLHRAREEASYRPVALLESIGSLLQNGITLLAMGAVLIPFGWWMPVALLLSTLPAFYVVLHYTLRHHRWRLRTTAEERKTWYYDWLLTTGDAAAELRLFALGNYFQSAYQNLRRRLRGERLRLARDQSIAELVAGALALLITGLAMAWMIWRAVQGFVTLGELALFYQAFNLGQRLMRALLENVGQLYANSLFLGNLFEFLALEPKVVDPDKPETAPARLTEGIRFRGVSFGYAGSARCVLRDFNLLIPAGRVVAIVGTNGAGKTTLIKLLCRLYDPDNGSIEIDGIDLRRLSVEKLRQHLTVLFQEPVHYSATVRENIALGSLASSPTLDEIEEAARSSGAQKVVERLPESYDNMLGKWFASGTELSVGEWQRIALARAFLRQAPVIILDEPTSAMDPWAEEDWLERFRRLADGRTALIITHRFTTAMRADIIHVMTDGQIVESGSHEELLAHDGLYAESWRAQMREQPPQLQEKGVS